MSKLQIQTDVIHNGSSSGAVGQELLDNEFDTERMRPYIDNHKYLRTGKLNKNYKKRCFNRYAGEEFDTVRNRMMPVYDVVPLKEWDPVYNATSLTKDEWKLLDDRVITVARNRMKAWSDLVAANSVSIDGYGHMLWEYETTNDPGEVTVDMTGDGGPRSDRVLFELQAIPLPITYGAYTINDRKMVISRNKGQGIDTRLAEAYARRIAEHIEKTLIGTVTGLTYGITSQYGRAATVYGYTNFPPRVTKTDLTTPTGSNGVTVYNDFVEMRELMYAQNMYGPFMVYYSTGYDTYLDTHISTSEIAAGKLRQAVESIDGIAGIRRLDFLTSGYQQIWVQMTSDVARAVMGMPIRTVQYDTQGGKKHHFWTGTIMVPQLFADYNGQCGIGVATTA